jgi:transposase
MNWKQMRIDPAEVVRLYVEEEWSIREIADHLGSSYGRVYGILRNRVALRTAAGRTRRQVAVAETMRARIVGGDWKPRHKVLSPEELAAIFGVGPQTVRLAIADLRRRGYLRSVPGRGIYVLPPEEWPS